MPKFKVQVQEVCTYEVEVVALSHAGAKAMAIHTMVNADDINVYFTSCDERDAVDVTPLNKHFELEDSSLTGFVKFPISCWRQAAHA